MHRVIRLLMFAAIGWMVLGAWRAVPYFSQGFGVGVSYVGYEAQELLNDFALASERLLYFAKMRKESIEYPKSVGSDRPQPRRFESLQ